MEKVISIRKIQIAGASLKKAFLSVVLVLLAVLGQAQQIEEYLIQAGENNPEVRANFQRYLANLERVPQVGSLPDPELSLGVFLQPMERLMGNQRADISIMQMFPWFGMLRTQKDEASLMANASYEQFRESKNQLFFEVKSTYYELHLLQKEIEITEDNLEILRTMERLALIRYRGGNIGGATSSASTAVRAAGSNVSSPRSSGMSMGQAGAGSSGAADRRDMGGSGGGMNEMGGGSSGGKLSDVLRLQIQIRSMESQLETLADKKRPLMFRFNKLLGTESTAEIQLEQDLSPRILAFNGESFIDSVMQDNPMLKMLEAEAEVFSKQEQMAKLDGRPMIGVGANYMVFSPRAEMGFPGGSGSMEYMPSGMGNNMIMPMVTLSLPIYRKKYKAAQSEARYNREAIQYQKENAENELLVQLEETIREIRDSERKVLLLDEQVELTQQALDLMVTAYANEGSSFEELLSVQRELLDYRLELISAIVNQHTAYAMLDMLVAKGIRE
ncbi:TolC family protein [Litoribacter ruber]|uniref:TolC family protein n=1 Tax=Litoribacter ruber TaxID=702568 RepID=A0AAP2CES9_9BACT|nr:MULTISPECIES: TolC family protein [Litoribacter]MBS9523068.1 TolC family protein [Litoribacter alkaliphilus]MBT0810768.1 TolC family protein [Litoribacter ruber]